MDGKALRVAAYCRVSTDSEEQLHSLASQKQYFEAYIRENPAWQLTGVFVDEAASGTSVRSRERFQAMLRAAERGEIDLILTKEVSRFARNTVDTLAYTRRLKALGVGVIFLSDHIDTRQDDGEFRLTIMASVAQEESRKTSQRVKWGQKRSMERGVVFGNDSLYGYQTRDGRLTVRPEEAEVVRLIFSKCAGEGKGAHVIARELQQAGVATPRGGARWSPATVRNILQNEKYCGDLRQKKYVTPDFLSHKKLPNRGQEPQIYLPAHHEAVVSRALFTRAQEALARRARTGEHRHSVRYWCSGKLQCGLCGSVFVPRRTVRDDGTAYVLWCCRARRQGMGCHAPSVNEVALERCARHALMQLDFDCTQLLAALQCRLTAPPARQPGADARQAARLRHQQEKAVEAFLRGDITAEELACVRARSAAAQRSSARAEEETDWANAVQSALAQSPHVLAETVEAIKVCGDTLEIAFYGIAARFTVRYRASGRGEGYHVEILSLTAGAPPENPA